MTESTFTSQRFMHKQTGEIVTQVPILEIKNYQKYYGTCVNCGSQIDQYGRCGYNGDD